LKGIKYVDYRLRGEPFQNQPVYKRHAFTGTGVSPLGVPGDASHLVVTDSDEHSEEGHITEDGETRRRMVEKRLLRKLPLIRAEMAPPLFYGAPEPEIVVTGWGSTYGVMREAVDLLSKTRNIAMLHFSEVYPLPLTTTFNYMETLGKAKLTICVENNAAGKFAALMRSETGYAFGGAVNRFDGRPFTVENFVGEINGHIDRL
jgi:2-oxoglutarate/2-oxoacid ferredoxin oxidoreductase subunit alpha